jgi:hypothetical protein
MAYILRYRCEFDTIKGRQVKVDIEKERNIVSPVNFSAIAASVFSASNNSLVTGTQALTFLEVGDIITISGTANNNKTFTLKDFSYTTAGFGSTTLFFNEAVINETDGSFQMTISSPSVTNLTASSESPLELSYANGEFEKMNPIRESKMRIKILTDNVTYEDFTVNYDTQYKVKLYIDNTLEWSGWLDNDYITELFLDTLKEIELSANDGLSILKTMPLKTQTGDQMWGFFRIKEFIANALFPTGLNLDFVSFINMYPENVVERNYLPPTFWDNDAFFYARIYASAFLKGPRDFDDCYEVLSKIMQAFGCTLYQARGKWYIVQTNDRIAGVLDATIRDYTGAATGISMNQSFKIDIGLNEVTKLINADALVSLEKPFKEVAIKHKFDMPPIYFRNFDLLDTAPDAYSGVAPAYWTGAPSNLATFYGYINQGEVFIDTEAGTGAEIRRGLLFQGGSGVRPAGAKMTTSYPVNAGDHINFGFSVKFNVAYFQWGSVWAHVLFISESGQQFYLDMDGKWKTTFKNVGYTYNKVEDRRFWKSFNISTNFRGADGIPNPGVPANGSVYLILTGTGSDILPSAVFDVFYKDLDFSIETSFNAMTEVDGYEYVCSQSANLKNQYDNEIFMADAPNISTKGSILETDYVKIGNWRYKGTHNIPTNPILPFAKYITRTYWRSMYRKFMRLEGRLYDLYQGSRLLSPLNSVEFTEVEDKEFMITTLQMDIRQESAEFTMIELRNTANNSDFTQNGTESFRYLNVKAKDENDPIKEPKTPIDWKFGTLGVISSLMRRNKRRRFNNYS